MNRKIYKIVIIMSLLFLSSCGDKKQLELPKQDARIQNLILKLENIPMDKWDGGAFLSYKNCGSFFQTYITVGKETFRIEISDLNIINLPEIEEKLDYVLPEDLSRVNKIYARLYDHFCTPLFEKRREEVVEYIDKISKR